MERGYVKLWRKTLDSGLLTNPSAWQVFGYLLLNATRNPRRIIVSGQAVDLKAGDIVTGRKKLSEALKLSEQNIRTVFGLLERLEIITTKSTNKYTIVSLINWDTYQEDSPSNQPTNHQRVTNGSPQNKKERSKNNNSDSEANASSSSFPATAVAERTLEGRKKVLHGKRAETFLRFWDAFADKRGYREAIDAWANIPELTNQLVDRICEAAARYAEQRQDIKARNGTPKMAQGWINSRRWEDEDTSENRGWNLI